MADQPWTWKPPESSESIKRSMSRQDAHDRVCGIAAYTRDIYLPGMLYAKILTSPYAHAKIMRAWIPARREALVGVRDILKFDDPDIAKDMQAGTDTSMAYSIPTLPGTERFLPAPHGSCGGRRQRRNLRQGASTNRDHNGKNGPSSSIWRMPQSRMLRRS